MPGCFYSWALFFKNNFMAIKVSKKKVTRDWVFGQIDEYDVFARYMPWKFTLNKGCKSPFTDDKHPSCVIGNKFGHLTFKCFNSENRGDAISFVIQMFNLTYEESLIKIAEDFKLTGEPKKIITGQRAESIHRNMFLQATNKPFTEKDKAYLNDFFLTPRDLNFCKDTRAYSTLEWAINRKKQALKKNETCFYYHLKNPRGEWIKVYRPEASKKDKWRSSIPFTEMHGVGNISSGCKTGIITKSLKDGAFINKFILPCVEIVQAEDYACITPENKIRLKESCEALYISFDNDPTGVKASSELVKELGCKYINPPRMLYEKGATDWTDMAKYYKDPKSVIEFFKYKKVIL
jgi:hypothetical protein